MRTLLVSSIVLALGVGAVPASAQYYNGPRDHQGVSRAELQRDQDRYQSERQDLRMAQRYGSPRDVREQGKDVKRAEKEYRQDARDWHRGRAYSYNRPDPRYNGYYADNYYRGGNYQPRRLGANDRVYRGTDNRYYCRRNDGTTGLIVGALGGGVLGNVIAPGGSKTIGSLLGGGLGAVLGSSIDKGNVTCR